MADARRYVLAIDMGTGTVKAAVVSNQGEIVGAAMRGIATQQLPGGGAEQDPAGWWDATVAAAREAITASAVPPADVLAIKCATQWAVTVPVDERGNALSGAISWMDTRGGPYVRRLIDGPLKVAGYDVRKLRRWLKLSGGAPVPAGLDGLGHVLHLKNDRPEVYEATHAFLEPMDYLNLRLTGRAAATAGTMFTYWVVDNRDPARTGYDDGLLKLAGLDRAKLPELIAPDAVVGTLTPEAAAALGLSTDTPVLAGACDLHSATIGAGSVEDGDAYFYVGTSSWMSCHLSERRRDLRHLLTTMPATLPGRYVVVAEQGMAGRCLDFLKDNILYPDGQAPPDVYERLAAGAAEVPPGSDGLIFTPWINGVVVPKEDHVTRSAFFNQTWRTTRGHYARAVMEGVAYNLRWLRGHLEKFVGRRFERLSFIGGGAQSDLWCQIHADILGVPIRQVEHPRYANAVGTALSAFVALGELGLEQVPALVGTTAVFEPQPEAQRVHDAQYAEFMRFYRRARPIYKRLNGRVASPPRPG
jgi:xylulokinase